MFVEWVECLIFLLQFFLQFCEFTRINVFPVNVVLFAGMHFLIRLCFICANAWGLGHRGDSRWRCAITPLVYELLAANSADFLTVFSAIKCRKVSNQEKPRRTSDVRFFFVATFFQLQTSSTSTTFRSWPKIFCAFKLTGVHVTTEVKQYNSFFGAHAAGDCNSWIKMKSVRWSTAFEGSSGVLSAQNIFFCLTFPHFLLFSWSFHLPKRIWILENIEKGRFFISASSPGFSCV